MLVRHDRGCNYARPEGGGHSDAAKRMSDHYNLHIAAGAIMGWWVAFALNDGATDGDVYQTKAEAVFHQHHNEWWFTFVKIGGGVMTVCQAESLLYMGRMQAKLRLADRDDRQHGGYEVISRITIEDHWRQMEALRTGRGAIALGYRN